MFYVKTRLTDGVTLTIPLTDDNVTFACPMTGEEMPFPLESYLNRSISEDADRLGVDCCCKAGGEDEPDAEALLDVLCEGLELLDDIFARLEEADGYQ